MNVGAHVAIMVAHAAKRRQEQEEAMVTYKSDDLNGWEFKIVRSATGKFRKYENVQQVIREEAQAGWEMVEKFDDNRLRFKRRIERRSGDQFLNQDPYRTNVGTNYNTVVLLVLGISFLILGVVLVTMFAAR